MNPTKEIFQRVARQAISILCAVLLVQFPFGVPVAAQTRPAQGPPAQPSGQLLTAEQLDDLVAPIALYPDALLSQLLVASTYPLEIVEASQWLQQNRNLSGQQLMDAARQKNWDPSVQALVAFPDVVGRLSSNITWTTDLGNAFLAQQADVMNAVQAMRARARAAGRLNSTAQQTVTTETQGDRSAIEIAPADPQVIYVPQYNPEYIWGPPVYGYYPPLYYPEIGFGFGFGAGIFLGSFFGGWGGWGWGGWGWGWGPNWFGCSIFTNNFFFNHYGFHGWGGGFGRTGVWAHNPYHRLGVPYANSGLANRFGGSSIGRSGAVRTGGFGQRGTTPGNRSGFQGNARSFAPQGSGAASGGWHRFGETNGGSRAQGPSQTGRAATGGAGQWNRFNGSSAAPANRGGAYRSSPYSGNTFAGRSAPQTYRSAPSYGGGRSFGGSSRPSYGSSRPSYGGGGARSYGGGGGSRSFSSGHSGGFSSGGSHGGGGGSHGGHR